VREEITYFTEISEGKVDNTPTHVIVAVVEVLKHKSERLREDCLRVRSGLFLEAFQCDETHTIAQTSHFRQELNVIALYILISHSATYSLLTHTPAHAFLCFDVL
jgi:hypothetical protein